MLHSTLFRDQEFKKYLGSGIALPPLGASILVPLALAPVQEILDLPLPMVLAAAATLALFLGRRLEAAPVTLTSASAAALADDWAALQPSGPRKSLEPSQTGSKKYDLACH